MPRIPTHESLANTCRILVGVLDFLRAFSFLPFEAVSQGETPLARCCFGYFQLQHSDSSCAPTLIQHFIEHFNVRQASMRLVSLVLLLR